jgi:hypothetical protein
MRGSVRAPRFFSVPLKAITATPGTYRPSCKPIVVLALKARPIQSMF